MIALSSGCVFYKWYGCATYETWRTKINPEYPSPALVRGEVFATFKGMAAASLAPSLSLYLTQRGVSQAYCGVAPHGWAYLAASFVVVWVLSDIFEWAYHRLGHVTARGWEVHKHHHRFHNPSPFAVIADEPLDQFVRALPLLLFPLAGPVNMDLLFGTFAVFFYVYGVFLHFGHELEWPNAHTPHLNSSFHHYIHHARSVIHKPYHTGFFFQAWDAWSGAVYPIEAGPTCPCANCARARGERSRARWATVAVPDYGVLLAPRFWLGKAA